MTFSCRRLINFLVATRGRRGQPRCRERSPGEETTPGKAMAQGLRTARLDPSPKEANAPWPKERRSTRCPKWRRSKETQRSGLVSWRKSRSEEHTSELQSLRHLVCRLLLEKKKEKNVTELQVTRE